MPPQVPAPPVDPLALKMKMRARALELSSAPAEPPASTTVNKPTGQGDTWGDWVKDMGREMGPSTIGAWIGAAGGPVGMAAGAFLGGFGGSLWRQNAVRERAQARGEVVPDYDYGEAGLSAGINLIPIPGISQELRAARGAAPFVKRMIKAAPWTAVQGAAHAGALDAERSLVHDQPFDPGATFEHMLGGATVGALFSPLAAMPHGKPTLPGQSRVQAGAAATPTSLVRGATSPNAILSAADVATIKAAIKSGQAMQVVKDFASDIGIPNPDALIGMDADDMATAFSSMKAATPRGQQVLQYLLQHHQDMKKAAQAAAKGAKSSKVATRTKTKAPQPAAMTPVTPPPAPTAAGVPPPPTAPSAKPPRTRLRPAGTTTTPTAPKGVRVRDRAAIEWMLINAPEKVTPKDMAFLQRTAPPPPAVAAPAAPTPQPTPLKVTRPEPYVGPAPSMQIAPTEAQMPRKGKTPPPVPGAEAYKKGFRYYDPTTGKTLDWRDARSKLRQGWTTQLDKSDPNGVTKLIYPPPGQAHPAKGQTPSGTPQAASTPLAPPAPMKPAAPTAGVPPPPLPPASTTPPGQTRLQPRKLAVPATVGGNIPAADLAAAPAGARHVLAVQAPDGRVTLRNFPSAEAALAAEAQIKAAGQAQRVKAVTDFEPSVLDEEIALAVKENWNAPEVTWTGQPTESSRSKESIREEIRGIRNATKDIRPMSKEKFIQRQQMIDRSAELKGTLNPPERITPGPQKPQPQRSAKKPAPSFIDPLTMRVMTKAEREGMHALGWKAHLVNEEKNIYRLMPPEPDVLNARIKAAEAEAANVRATAKPEQLKADKVVRGKLKQLAEQISRDKKWLAMRERVEANDKRQPAPKPQVETEVVPRSTKHETRAPGEKDTPESTYDELAAAQYGGATHVEGLGAVGEAFQKGRNEALATETRTGQTLLRRSGNETDFEVSPTRSLDEEMFGERTMRLRPAESRVRPLVSAPDVVEAPETPLPRQTVVVLNVPVKPEWHGQKARITSVDESTTGGVAPVYTVDILTGPATGQHVIGLERKHLRPTTATDLPTEAENITLANAKRVGTGAVAQEPWVAETSSERAAADRAKPTIGTAIPAPPKPVATRLRPGETPQFVEQVEPPRLNVDDMKFARMTDAEVEKLLRATPKVAREALRIKISNARKAARNSIHGRTGETPEQTLARLEEAGSEEAAADHWQWMEKHKKLTAGTNLPKDRKTPGPPRRTEPAPPKPVAPPDRSQLDSPRLAQIRAAIDAAKKDPARMREIPTLIREMGEEKARLASGAPEPVIPPPPPAKSKYDAVRELMRKDGRMQMAEMPDEWFELKDKADQTRDPVRRQQILAQAGEVAKRARQRGSINPQMFNPFNWRRKRPNQGAPPPEAPKHEPSDRMKQVWEQRQVEDAPTEVKGYGPKEWATTAKRKISDADVDIEQAQELLRQQGREADSYDRLSAFKGGESGKTRAAIIETERILKKIHKQKLTAPFQELVDLLTMKHKSNRTVLGTAEELAAGLAEGREVWQAIQRSARKWKRFEKGNALPQGYTPSIVEQEIDKLRKDLTPQQWDTLMEGVQSFSDSVADPVLDRAIVEGLITPKTAEQYRAAGPYFAMERIRTLLAPDVAQRLAQSAVDPHASDFHSTSAMAGASLSGEAKRIYEEFVGTTQATRDPIGATIRAAQLLHNEIGRSNVVRSAVEQMSTSDNWKGRITPLKPRQQPSRGSIAVKFYDPKTPGKVQRWQIPAEIGVPLITGDRNMAALHTGWLRVTDRAASVLRANLVTFLNPGFPPVNVFRDVHNTRPTLNAYAPGTFDLGSPVDYMKTWYEWGKAVKSVAAKDPEYLAMLKNNELMGTWQSHNLEQELIDEAYHRLNSRLTRNAASEEGLVSLIKDLPGAVGLGINTSYATMVDWSTIAEEATKLMGKRRMAVRRPDIVGPRKQRLIRDKTGSPDFAVGGEWKAQNNMLFMLFNAGVRGTQQVADLVRQHPEAAATVALMQLGKDVIMDEWNNQFKDEEGRPAIEHIPSQLREANNIVFLPRTTVDTVYGKRQVFLMFPRGFVQRYGHTLSDGVRKLAKGEFDPAEFAARMVENVSPLQGELDFSTAANTAKTLFWSGVASAHPGLRITGEMLANQRAFTGMPLVPQRLQGVLPTEQYTAFTSPTAIAAGRKIGVSPIYIEYLIRSIAPGGGDTLLSTLDMLARQAVDPDKAFGTADNSWVASVRRVPVAGAISRRFIGPGAVDQELIDLRNQFYKTADAVQTANKSVPRMLEHMTTQEVFNDEDIAGVVGKPMARIFAKSVGQLSKVYHAREMILKDLIEKPQTGEALAKSQATLRDLAKAEFAILRSIAPIIPEKFKSGTQKRRGKEAQSTPPSVAASTTQGAASAPLTATATSVPPPPPPTAVSAPRSLRVQPRDTSVQRPKTLQSTADLSDVRRLTDVDTFAEADREAVTSSDLEDVKRSSLYKELRTQALTRRGEKPEELSIPSPYPMNVASLDVPDKQANDVLRDVATALPELAQHLTSLQRGTLTKGVITRMLQAGLEPTDFPATNLMGITDVTPTSRTSNQVTLNSRPQKASLYATLIHELTHTLGYAERDAARIGNLILKAVEKRRGKPFSSIPPPPPR